MPFKMRQRHMPVPLPLLLPVVILHWLLLYKVACRKKCIPQFDCTHYLAVFYKVQPTTLSSQTLDVVWVELIQIYQVLAPGLMRQSSTSA